MIKNESLWREPLSHNATLTLTPTERELLDRMADEDGSTLRGFIRKLIRAEARRRGLLEPLTTPVEEVRKDAS